MSTTVLEGVRLAYSVQGAGEPMLMIQGLGYGRGGWGPAPGMLARRFQVVTLDNRGFGDSDAPPGPYTTAQLAEDALAVLDAVEIETAHVVGISLGGMVAQELVLARPERVRRLVLCSTTPGGAESFPMPEQTVALMGRQPHLEPEEAMRLFVVNALSPDSARSESRRSSCTARPTTSSTSEMRTCSRTRSPSRVSYCSKASATCSRGSGRRSSPRSSKSSFHEPAHAGTVDPQQRASDAWPRRDRLPRTRDDVCGARPPV